MTGKNLCFVREPEYIHDILNETTDEGKTKEAVIGVCGILGEIEQNYKIISHRLDRVEDKLLSVLADIGSIQKT